MPVFQRHRGGAILPISASRGGLGTASTRYSNSAQCGAFQSGRSNPAGFFSRFAMIRRRNGRSMASAQPAVEIVEWIKEFLLKP
jgi:hypothetical protein